MIDREKLQQWWDLFVGEGSFTEVRILGRFQYSGYFKNVDNLYNALRPYADMPDEQIYFVMNEINPACYGRQQSERIIKSPKITTTDSDICRRKTVMLDFDPIRATGVNASDEEFEYAHKCANKVFKYLREQGFSDPIACKSGNGWHLQYRVDLDNTPETTEIIKNFIKYLATQFTNDKVDVDEKIFNLARLCKLYSTTAKKGANIPERPWRMSEIVYIPKDWQSTPLEKFKAIADLLPKEEPKQAPNKKGWNRNANTEPFDLVSWLNQHGVTYREKSNSGSRVFELEYCPWV